ncbi:TlpA family protein disulfide reductase [Algoriphagus lutimaris]|uniref:TlpA family protein disulfide reductase n=1 Tax=Algoriphagus lutimaris TaxID=613197 RepID=UPI00196B6A2D|nr:TlpA disulfide reductase family protein [Algoriphagus lutimaris]MBN3519373.1 TlpA family protein disulfide reductase [Algoriphagus lutimaris]
MTGKNTINWVISVLLCSFFIACKQEPMQDFEESREKMNEIENMSFSQTAYYPNPMGMVDTLSINMDINRNPQSILGYDFLIKGEGEDMIYENGEFKLVNHPKREVTIFPSDKSIERDHNILNNRFIQYSPLTLMNLEDWYYSGDTILQESNYAMYARVDLDTVINENSVYTVFRIYIHGESKLPERFERNNYYKGELSQRVVYEYDQYRFGSSNSKSQYSIPSNFVSVPYGISTQDLVMLKKGEKAPDFEGFDLKNEWVETGDFADQQVLVMFSAINCSYCKLAMEFLTEENNQLSEGLNLISFYPEDSKGQVSRYMNYFNPSFSVIANAGQVGQNFGVNVYPTFYLINPQGKIEEVVQGFNRDFLNKFLIKKGS